MAFPFLPLPAVVPGSIRRDGFSAEDFRYAEMVSLYSFSCSTTPTCLTRDRVQMYPDVSRNEIKLLLEAEVAVSQSNWKEAQQHLKTALEAYKRHFRLDPSFDVIHDHPFEQKVRYLLGLTSYQLLVSSRSYCLRS